MTGFLDGVVEDVDAAGRAEPEIHHAIAPAVAGEALAADEVRERLRGKIAAAHEQAAAAADRAVAANGVRHRLAGESEAERAAVTAPVVGHASAPFCSCRGPCHATAGRCDRGAPRIARR